MQTQGLTLLRRDPLYPHIPPNEVEHIVDQALRAGMELCDEMTRRLQTRDPFLLAQELDVRVVFHSEPLDFQPHIILSSYHPKPATITIFEESIDNCRERLERDDSPRAHVISTHLTGLCVAHELYHHVERQNGRHPMSGFRIPQKFGFLKIFKHLTMTSEIAAHAFAAHLFDLTFLPSTFEKYLNNTDNESSYPGFSPIIH